MIPSLLSFLKDHLSVQFQSFDISLFFIYVRFSFGLQSIVLDEKMNSRAIRAFVSRPNIASAARPLAWPLVSVWEPKTPPYCHPHLQADGSGGQGVNFSPNIIWSPLWDSADPPSVETANWRNYSDVGWFFCWISLASPKSVPDSL